MKTLVLGILCCVGALSLCAQSTVTVELNGSRNREVIIDGQSYIVSNYTTTGNKSVITIPELSSGSHTMVIKRTRNNNSSATTSSTKNFHVRDGYDLKIVVNGSGAISTHEIRSTTNAYRTPMSDEGFEELYSEVQAQWRAASRMNTLRTEFSNGSNYFTTNQARQLIMLMNSESQRLQLAKLAVHRLTDINNVSRLYDVFTSQNSRNELAAYVKSNVSTGGSGTLVRTPMTSAQYNQLYSDVQNEWGTTAKVSLLNNTFGSTSVFLTSAQARQLILLIPDESNRLHLAKAAYRGITDPDNFKIMYDIFNSTASRAELAAYLRSNYGVTTTDTYTYKTPMTDSEYSKLYRQVQNTWGLGAKMNSLTAIFASTTNYFTTAQAEDLIRLVSSESNRLELAKAAFDNITDPASFSNLYDVLSSQSSRDELAAWVNANGYYNSTAGTNYSYKTPMGDTEYNSLYRQVQNTWGFGAKMNSLSQIFANNAYYFTTAQAKELVKLVSSESNRLALAKASYDNITDPSNFSSMYDVLESQSSRDELEAFVNSYSYNR